MKRLLLYLTILVSVSVVLSLQPSCTNSSASTMAHPKVEAKLILPKVESLPAVEKVCYNEKILPLIEIVLNKVKHDDVRYDWYDVSSCNVGLFAQLCTEDAPVNLRKRFDREYSEYVRVAKESERDYAHSWKDAISYYCGITNRPIHGIINQILKAGFTHEDIGHLEFINDPYILSKCNIDKSKGDWWTIRDNYITYLSTWKKIIEDQS